MNRLINYLSYIRIYAFIKIFLFLLLLLILPIPISYIYIRQESLTETKKSLDFTISRIKRDLKYKNGAWDLDLYNDDPETPSPTSTNAFPLYVIGIDGYIIERSKPISGVLNSTDFKHLLSFKTPQLAKTPTNETWRVVSKPITTRGKTIGVIVASYYNPNVDLYGDIDRKLNEAVGKIYSKTIIKGEKIDLSHFEKSSIPYEISYQVVSSLNESVLSNGKVPSFIDVSYVASELDNGERIVRDKKTHEQYLLISVPIRGKNGLPVGVIVTGKSISSMFSVLNNYFFFSILTRFLFAFPLAIITMYVLRKDLLGILRLDKQDGTFKQIAFNAEESTVTIDRKKIEIPYASNQYYLCKAVFSAPKKKWEVDELLEKFGEEEMSGKARKVYDAMLAVNKKLGIKLVRYQDKTYVLNSEYLAKLNATKPHM